MSNTISPNMNLIVPGVGTEAGPTYAFDINSSLTLIDQHDHSFGKGVQITPAGLNINSALTLQGNALTSVASVTFVPQASNSTLTTLYVKPGSESTPIQDLWFNDGAGNPVQLTSGGLVNATIASLPGESYAGGTFTWRTVVGSPPVATTVPANFNIGSIVLQPNVASTPFSATISATGVTSVYTISLPASLLGTQGFVTLSSSGQIIEVPYPLTAASIAAGTITTTQISSTAGIIGTQLASNANILGSQLSLGANVLGSQLVTNPNFSGNEVQENGRNVVVSGANAASSLAIVRGSFQAIGGSFSSIAGEGFTLAPAYPAMTVNYTNPFSSLPTVTCVVYDATGEVELITRSDSAVEWNFTGLSASSFVVDFIAIGPR